MRVRFVIPNRENLDAAPTLYQYAEVAVVPRVDESVYLGLNEDSATPWRVKWVGHTLTVPVESDAPAGAHRIDVRLIEPDHWTQS
jgi:hypothetical protein